MRILILALAMMLALTFLTLTPGHNSLSDTTRTVEAATYDCPLIRTVCGDIWDHMADLCISANNPEWPAAKCLIDKEVHYKQCVTETSEGQCTPFGTAIIY